MSNVIQRSSFGAWAPALTQTFVIPLDKIRNAKRVSLFILPVGDGVTVTVKCVFPTIGGPDTVILDQAEAATATDGEAFIFTTEDIFPGDLLVDVTSGAGAPTRVELVATAISG